MSDEQPILVQPSKVVRKSAIRQTVSVVAFMGGISWFSYQMGEMFIKHSDAGWGYYTSPMAVGEILKTAGSAGIALAGALGVNVRDLFARKVKE